MHAPPLVNGTGAERMPCVEERLITTNVAWRVALALPVSTGLLHPVTKHTSPSLASAAPLGGSPADVPEQATNSSLLFEQLCDHLQLACRENGISIRTIGEEAKEVKEKVEARMLQMCSPEEMRAYRQMYAPGTPSHSAPIIAGKTDDRASGDLNNASLPTSTSLDAGSVAAPDSPFEVAAHEDKFDEVDVDEALTQLLTKELVNGMTRACIENGVTRRDLVRTGREYWGGATPLSSYETESSKERWRKAMRAVIDHMRRNCSAGAMALFDEERKRMRQKRKR